MSTIIGGVNSGSAYIVTDNLNCQYINISGSTRLSTTPVTLYGIQVNSHSSGTIKIWDDPTAAGTIVCNTITLAAGERFVNLMGITTGTACYVTIGGTADITIGYRKTRDYSMANNVA